MPTTHLALAAAAILAVTGTVFWLVVFASSVALRRLHPTLDPDAVETAAGKDILVSVIVPANDEEENLAGCLRTLLAQTHRRLELIVIDDRSRDRTRSLAEGIAATDARVRVAHVDHLPRGWTGKTHALHRGAELANGTWLFFTDADTLHHPSSLAALLGRARAEELDLLSGWPALDRDRRGTAPLDALCAAVLASWYRPRMQGGRRQPATFANGQALLIRREAYRRVGGHESVRGRLLEDIALVERVQAHGMRSDVLLLQQLVRVRAYASLRASLVAWSRIFVEGSHRRPRRLLKPAAALPLMAASGYAAIAAALALGGPFTWLALVAGLADVVAMTICVAFVYHCASVPRRFALLAPLLAPLTAVPLAIAARRARRRGAAIQWHGVEYRSGVE